MLCKLVSPLVEAESQHQSLSTSSNACGLPCWSRSCSWQGVRRHPAPHWLLSNPGAEVEVVEDAVLEASHSVQGCDCFWVSRSGKEAGLEEQGAWSPQTLDLKTEGTG